MKKFYKSDLVQLVSEHSHITKKDATAQVEAVLNSLAYLLDVPGNSVQLRDFGTFHCKLRASRTGRNPSTGAPVAIPAKQTVTFKPSKSMVQELV